MNTMNKATRSSIHSGRQYYAWRCPHCRQTGTIYSLAHQVLRDVENQHAIVSEDCLFDDEAVTVRRDINPVLKLIT
jgi:hypothetical protein